jgi:hypothetical protein
LQLRRGTSVESYDRRAISHAVQVQVPFALLVVQLVVGIANDGDLENRIAPSKHVRCNVVPRLVVGDFFEIRNYRLQWQTALPLQIALGDLGLHVLRADQR